jgi:hypothetical protein
VDVPAESQTTTGKFRSYKVRARNGIIAFENQNDDSVIGHLALEKIILTNV